MPKMGGRTLSTWYAMGMEQTKRWIGISLADGRRYRVQAHEVAHDRATYYAGKVK